MKVRMEAFAGYYKETFRKIIYGKPSPYKPGLEKWGKQFYGEYRPCSKSACCGVRFSAFQR